MASDKNQLQAGEEEPKGFLEIWVWMDVEERGCQQCDVPGEEHLRTGLRRTILSASTDPKMRADCRSQREQVRCSASCSAGSLLGI